jgi:uncharacterized membrane protein
MGDMRRKSALFQAQSAVSFRHPVGRVIANEQHIGASYSRLQKRESGLGHALSIPHARVDRTARLRDTLTMRFVTATLAALALLPFLPLPAHAALTVCNRTDKAARVAVGRFDGTAWLSEGWWNVAPEKCTAVVPGRLKARYYYLYATDGGAGSWDGARHFCVGSGEDKFQSRLRSHCEARGMDTKGFFAVDTKDAADYTQTLSD